jgi:CHAT domain-containing protein
LVVEEAVRRLREATIAGDRVQTRALAAEIQRELLPRELVEHLLAGAPQRQGRLLFLLHGPLERLPVEVLELDGAPLDARLVPVVLPGLPEARPGAAAADALAGRWSLLGDPLDEHGLARLPGSRAELSALARLRRDASLAIGRAFDRTALHEAFASGRPLHVSTHLLHGCGSSAGRLLDIGFELSGTGAYCASELLGVRPRLPLAVLAACETAEGRFVDAEGLNGLARVFLESGTRNVLVTLWPVEDSAAQAFAVEFHRALLAQHSPSRAAALARTHLRERGFSSADWAAFRLLGRD